MRESGRYRYDREQHPERKKPRRPVLSQYGPQEEEEEQHEEQDPKRGNRSRLCRRPRKRKARRRQEPLAQQQKRRPDQELREPLGGLANWIQIEPAPGGSVPASLVGGKPDDADHAVRQNRDEARRTGPLL